MGKLVWQLRCQGLTEYEFLGKPWEQRELYRRLSPISYVENVKAATLIIAGEEDFRTPMTDNEQWFMALKKRKVPVELVRYRRRRTGSRGKASPGCWWTGSNASAAGLSTTSWRSLRCRRGAE